jgi:outer membrane murein-binding lipoprotein Lpp
MYEDGEIPQEAFNDTLQAIDEDFADKIDFISCFIKELQSEVREIKREIDALTKRKTAKKTAADRLKEYIKNQMLSLDKFKIETPRNKIQIRKNPPSVEIDGDFILWATENAVHYLNFSAPEPDKTKIKEALKNGEKIPHACLVQKERIEIK